MNAVILGYGVVGKGIEILAKALDDINIKYVYVRKEKENLPYFSNDEDMVVQDDIDIVFECLNGLEPANTLIQKALKKGKHVISSNKAVVATYLDTYLELEKEYGGSIQQPYQSRKGKNGQRKPAKPERWHDGTEKRWYMQYNHRFVRSRERELLPPGTSYPSTSLR